MSCFPCGAEGGGSTTPPPSTEDLNRWTNSLFQLLHNEDGRRRFRKFLLSHDLTESLDTLRFWEQCVVLISYATPGKVIEEAEDLYTFASDNVNFDYGQLKQLHDAIQTHHEAKIKTEFSKAMQTATELLEEHYRFFCRYLLQQRRMLPNNQR